jgi:TolB-like protein
MARPVLDSLSQASAREASGAPAECSIALLPLRNLSGAPRDEPLCAGLTGDIIHSLTRFRDLTVIAQHSALQVRALALAPHQIAERLGVRYLLTGDLQRRRRGLEVEARLLEAAAEHVIWTMKFDGPLGDVFAFQDRLTQIIAANLAVEIRTAELRRAAGSAPAALSAYGLVLRGQLLTHQYQRAANWRARLLFERARRLDPDYARSYAALSRTFNLDWRYAWSNDPGASLDHAVELAELAIQCDPFDARGHAELGFASLCHKQHDAALLAFERALELNPNDADILAEMGVALTSVGQNERAIEALMRAIRLNPLHPDWYLWYLGSVYFHLGDYAKAIATVMSMREPSEARRLLAASYAHLGEMDEARHHAAELIKVHPNFTIEHWRKVPPFKNPEPLERLIEGMRKAGLK